MKRFLVLLFIILVLLAIAAVLIPWTNTPTMTPQILSTPDGNRLVFEHATFGTNHLIGHPMAQRIARSPLFIRRILSPLSQRLGSVQTRLTTKPALVLWYGAARQMPANWTSTSLKAYLTDESGEIAGDDEYLWTSGNVGTLQATEFEAFPRRSKTVRLVLTDMNGTLVGTITNIPNPEYKQYPSWKPETLPATKKAGDLEVTLHDFYAGVGAGTHTTHKALRGGKTEITTKFSPKKPNGESHSIFSLSFRQGDNTNAPWSLAREVLSDATGNAMANSSMSGSGAGYYSVSPSLWTNESAWKLELELKRSGGFNSDELFTIKGIPLGQLNITNKLSIVTNFQGVAVEVEYFVFRNFTNSLSNYSSQQMSEISLKVKSLPDSTFLDLVDAFAGTNRVSSPSRSWGGDNQTYSFSEIPSTEKTLDLTFAVHASRKVDLLVAPVAPPARLLQKEEN